MPKGLTKAEVGLMITALLVAARIILRKWKSPHRPEVKEWLQIMSETTAFKLMIGRVPNVPSKSSQGWMYFDYSIGINS